MARRKPKGWRKAEKRDARQERIETRQDARTERAGLRGGRGGIDGGKLLDGAADFAEGFAEGGLGGVIFGGWGDDDDDRPQRDDLAPADAPAENGPAADGPAFGDDPIGWAQHNPGKAAGIGLGLALAGAKLTGRI